MLSTNELLCPICSNFDKLYIFGCQHFVCTNCISKITTCPICRMELKYWRQFRLIDMNLLTNKYVNIDEMYEIYKTKFWNGTTLDKLKEGYNRDNILGFLKKYIEKNRKKRNTNELEKIFQNDCEILYLLYLISGSYNGANKIIKNILKNEEWINIRAIGCKIYRSING